jgi:hypothetical protein
MWAACALAVVRSARYRSLLGGLGGGHGCLAVRAGDTASPERLGVTDVIAGYRLSSPVGY